MSERDDPVGADPRFSEPGGEPSAPAYYLRQERLHKLLAPFYDRFVESHTRDVTAVGIALLGNLTGRSVLDVGTGTGNLAFALAAAGAEVTAVDLSPALIRIAHRKNAAAAIRFSLMDATKLRFQDRQFDYACAAMLLHEIPDPLRDQAVAELVRVSRLGVLVIDYRQNQRLHWATQLVERLELSAYRTYLRYPLLERFADMGCATAARQEVGQFAATLCTFGVADYAISKP